MKRNRFVGYLAAVAVSVLLLGAAAARAAAPELDETNSWAFSPVQDKFTGDAVLDLSYLNEPVAGQSGFIRLSPDGNSFLRGDGQPIRFWSARVNQEIAGLPPEQVDQTSASWPSAASTWSASHQRLRHHGGGAHHGRGRQGD